MISFPPPLAPFRHLPRHLGSCTLSTVAYAGTCIQDALTDRPVSAYINFCPSGLNYNSMLHVTLGQKEWELGRN